jgi:hypothetical protein
MTAAATGNVVTGRNRGWPKAVRFALTENCCPINPNAGRTPISPRLPTPPMLSWLHLTPASAPSPVCATAFSCPNHFDHDDNGCTIQSTSPDARRRVERNPSAPCNADQQLRIASAMSHDRNPEGAVQGRRLLRPQNLPSVRPSETQDLRQYKIGIQS